MHLFFSIGPIRFDFSTFLSFIIGISFGFLILFLFYIYAVVKSLNKGLKLKAADEQDIDEEEIKWLIEDAQKQFKDKNLRNEIGLFKYLGQINRELSIDISKKFFPKSKYPYLELTVDETLKLSHYITTRIDHVLDGKILRLTRGMTLAKIVEANDAKTKIENNPIIHTALKYRKVTKAALSIVNAVNPVYWVRRLTQDTITNIVIVKIGMALIAITGEETYKIYSKKVFNEEKTIDTGVDALYNEIEAELKKEGGAD